MVLYFWDIINSMDDVGDRVQEMSPRSNTDLIEGKDGEYSE